MGTKKVSKTDMIRNLAREMIDNGKPPRPLEVVGALKKKGIHVVGSQVSMALRGTGMEFRPRARPTVPDPSAALKQATLQELNKAEEFVRSIGDEEKAMVALVALRQLRREPTQEPERHGGA